MLAEIAVKNFLLQLNKRYTERHLYRILQRELHMFENVEELYDTVELDIKDYFDDMEFHKNIALNGIEGGYQVIHYELLPYRIPIAFQSAIALDKDMKGYQVNDLHDFSPETRIQFLHLAVFPMKDTSVVIAFYHKRDKNYQRLRHQFNSINKETKLKYLKYLIFALQPKVTVKIGDKLLIPNTDYVPTYVKNIEPGTAIVIIIGIGNYTDAIKTTFTIEKHVHSFVDREQTVTPTCIQKGSESKKCIVCGEIETREIKMIGHKFSAWKTTSFNLKNKTSTQTRKCSSAERRKLR